MPKQNKLKRAKAGNSPAEPQVAERSRVLLGLTQLMNKQYVDPNINLDDAERAIAIGPSTKPSAPNPAHARLAELAAELDVPFTIPLDPDSASSSPAGIAAAPAATPPLASRAGPAPVALPQPASRAPPILPPKLAEVKAVHFDVPASSEEPAPLAGPGKEPAAASEESDEESEEESDEDSDEESGSETPAASAEIPIAAPAFAAPMAPSAVAGKPSKAFKPLDLSAPAASAPAPGSPILRNAVTAEGERRLQVNRVMKELRSEDRTGFSVQRERDQDERASKLEHIGQLRLALEEDSIDCKHIKDPAPDASMDEIEATLRLLQMKNNRNRFSSFAEEALLTAAEGLETVFDGKTAIPLLGWKPNYTGYHHTLRSKLYRMRHETATIVGDIIQKYELSAHSRVFLELLPSMIMYPRFMSRDNAPSQETGGPASDVRRSYAALSASRANPDLDKI